MKFLIVVGFILISAVCGEVELPSFSWERVSSRQTSMPSMKVTFPDGSEDYAVLQRYNPIPRGSDEREEDIDQCIFDGYLMNEEGVYVVMTGCPNSNSFEIQFNSRRLNGYMFKVTEGKVENIAPIFGKKVVNRDGSVGTFVDGVMEATKIESQIAVPSSPAVISPKGYNLKIKVRYDDAFKSKFGADVNNAARRIMTFAQSYWKLSASLGTQINFQIDANIQAISGKYAAATDLEKVSKFSTDATFDDNVYLTFRDNQYGTVGMGYVATVCHPPPYQYLRSNLNEYLNNDITAGQTVAHEIGHNMGMSHDFLNGDTNQKRYDSKGQLCTGKGGVMDYNVNSATVDKWSTCSVEDFKKYVGSLSSYCLTAV